jgi:hypothetical protein
LETYLRCVVSSTPRQWVKWLSLAKIWYNSSYHTSLKCSPFKALYGWDPSFGTTPVLAEAKNESVRNVLLERQRFLDLLKQNLARAKNKMKLVADAKRSARTF